jgi:deoxyribonuclease V
MNFPPLHDWPTTVTEATALQRELAGRIDTCSPLGDFDLVAGADISYNRHDPLLHASVVVWRVSTGEVIDAADVRATATFPYVPGYLSFRELPAVLPAFEALRTKPDVVMCDGQGTAHPRRFGLACHLGLWLNMPCLGCAKSRLSGTHVEPPPDAGSRVPLTDRGEVIGAVVRGKARVKPLWVSPGHRIDLDSAVRVVLACVRGYRVPEPTRQAHLRVNRLRLESGDRK